MESAVGAALWSCNKTLGESKLLTKLHSNALYQGMTSSRAEKLEIIRALALHYVNTFDRLRADSVELNSHTFLQSVSSGIFAKAESQGLKAQNQ